MLLFMVLVLSGLCFFIVLLHIKTQRALLSNLQEIVDNQGDAFSKLMQTTLLHLKSGTPTEAVQMQLVLEREQAILDQAAIALEQGLKQEPKVPTKRVIGYKGENGVVYKLMSTVPASFLEGIDKSRLVYAE